MIPRGQQWWRPREDLSVLQIKVVTKMQTEREEQEKKERSVASSPHITCHISMCSRSEQRLFLSSRYVWRCWTLWLIIPNKVKLIDWMSMKWVSTYEPHKPYTRHQENTGSWIINYMSKVKAVEPPAKMHSILCSTRSVMDKKFIPFLPLLIECKNCASTGSINKVPRLTCFYCT